MSRTFGTFIFDVDGTLLDTIDDLVVLTNKALEDAGFPAHTKAEIASFVGNGARALMQQAVPQNADPAEKEYALARWKALYPEYGYTHTEPFAGIPEVLAAMKGRGAKLGVLSNKYDQAVKGVIGTYLPNCFQSVHGECDLIPRKPDPTGLLYTIDELGSTPNTSVYLGDSPGDMVTARKAGAFALGVAWGYRSVESLSEAGADAILSTPDQLMEFL